MIIHSTLHKILALCFRISADPLDSDETRLNRAMLVNTSFMFIAAGLIWGAAYILLGEPLAGAIPLSYGIFSFLSVVFFALTRRYTFFRFSQLLLILLLPFLLMVALGGFINSSAVILWSFISPLGALLFSEPRSAPRWLLAYLAVLIVSGFLQPFVRVLGQKRLSFRIGMNSGPVLAGVIGHKKFQYDVWGDTVNIASRMESQGEPGKIQITQTTYELIKDDFVCEPKGQVVIKGKGLMETWNLVGSKG
ncbi:MAG TPA: adenylate/guanylate cyclase domain-containing protein [Anaerolineae bacterium]